MNIMPILEKECLMEIQKVRLVSGNDSFTAEYILDEWNLDYQKILDSSFNFTAVGLNPKLISWQSHHQHIDHIKLIGVAYDLKAASETGEKQPISFVWNIPCNMCISSLEFGNENNMSIELSGEMW